LDWRLGYLVVLSTLSISSGALLVGCTGGGAQPSVVWTDTSGLSMISADVQDRNVRIVLKYSGPCSEGSGDLTFGYSVNGHRVSDSSAAGTGVRVTIPPTAKGQSQVINHRMPVENPDSVFVRVAKWHCATR